MGWVRSDLARVAVEGRTIRVAGPVDGTPAPIARLAFAAVHLVMLLVLAGLAEEVDVALVGERRPAVLHGPLQRLADRAVETADLLLRQRVALALPPESRLEEDLVAVHVADAGDEFLIHEERLQLRLALGQHPAEPVPRQRGLE